MVVLDMEEEQVSRNVEPFTAGPKSQMAYDFDNTMKLNLEGGVFNIEQEKKQMQSYRVGIDRSYKDNNHGPSPILRNQE